MDFDYFEYSWLSWGLYLSTCYYHDLDFDTATLPYDYVGNYEFSETDTDKRLYGGEIGLFHEVEHNVQMLHDIYKELDTKPTLDISNPLYNDIVNGSGTSGIDWNVNKKQKGIFNFDELETIQNLLITEIGKETQFDYLLAYLYHINRVWAYRWIEIQPIENRAKCLLACFLLNDTDIFLWVDDIEGIEDLEDTATVLLNLCDCDEEINAYYEYILDNLSNEDLR